VVKRRRINARAAILTAIAARSVRGRLTVTKILIAVGPNEPTSAIACEDPVKRHGIHADSAIEAR